MKELIIEEGGRSNGHLYLIYDEGDHETGHAVSKLKGGTRVAVDQMSSYDDIEEAIPVENMEEQLPWPPFPRSPPEGRFPEKKTRVQCPLLKTETTSYPEENAGDLGVSSEEGVLVVGAGTPGRTLGGAPRAAKGIRLEGLSLPCQHLVMGGMDCTFM